MMTNLFRKTAAMAAAALCLLAPWTAAQAIEFDEVRDFQQDFVLSATAPARDRIELRWAIEDGFYYDFDLSLRISPDDFEAIEREMARIVSEDHPFERLEVSR